MCTNTRMRDATNCSSSSSFVVDVDVAETHTHTLDANNNKMGKVSTSEASAWMKSGNKTKNAIKNYRVYYHYRNDNNYYTEWLTATPFHLQVHDTAIHCSSCSIIITAADGVARFCMALRASHKTHWRPHWFTGIGSFCSNWIEIKLKLNAGIHGLINFWNVCSENVFYRGAASDRTDRRRSESRAYLQFCRRKIDKFFSLFYFAWCRLIWHSNIWWLMRTIRNRKHFCRLRQIITNENLVIASEILREKNSSKSLNYNENPVRMPGESFFPLHIRHNFWFSRREFSSAEYACLASNSSTRCVAAFMWSDQCTDVPTIRKWNASNPCRWTHFKLIAISGYDVMSESARPKFSTTIWYERQNKLYFEFGHNWDMKCQRQTKRESVNIMCELRWFDSFATKWTNVQNLPSAHTPTRSEEIPIEIIQR